MKNKKSACFSNIKLFLEGVIILIISCTTSVFSSDDLLLAYWNFENNDSAEITDESGNELHGTIIGSEDSYNFVKGIRGNAFQISGPDVYIKTGNRIDIGTSDFTIELWIRRRGGKDADLVTKRRDAGEDGFQLRLIGNKISFGIMGVNAPTAKYIEVRTADIAVLGNSDWHHLVCPIERNKPNIIMYVDGNPFPAQGIDPALAKEVNLGNSGMSFLYIGGWCYNDTRLISNFEGIIDEVRIYKRALTSDEIKRNFNSSKK